MNFLPVEYSVPRAMLKYLFHRSSGSRFPDTPDGAEKFTYHKRSGIKALLFALLLAAIVETVVLHYFLAMWNHWIALVATASSVWVVLQVLAQIRAIGMRPVFIDDGVLCIRNGMYELSRIPLSAIERVTVTGKDAEAGDSQMKPLHCCVPAGHNVIVYLNQQQEATLLYGKRRPFQAALLAIDEPQRFAEALSVSGEAT